MTKGMSNPIIKVIVTLLVILSSTSCEKKQEMDLRACRGGNNCHITAALHGVRRKPVGTGCF